MKELVVGRAGTAGDARVVVSVVVGVDVTVVDVNVVDVTVVDVNVIVRKLRT
ncbi:MULTISPECIES: hypothetical protein [Frankia]|uniref:hypothetical protein n=1 Tax=Frankia TaxID=1854 RepID=UPI00030DA2DC|nr:MULTISPECIES: hypothetical protein [Frankia]